MTPGKELDTLIAEMLGWKYCKSSFEQYEPSVWTDGTKTVWPRDFNPSTDIAAAWKVVEFITSKSHLNAFSIYSPTDECDKWFAGFDKKYHTRNYAEIFDLEYGVSAPHAICMAAIKTIGIT